ncbi:MAG: autotransporter assembly complex protein TamA [Pseudomonadales bacterium]
MACSEGATAGSAVVPSSSFRAAFAVLLSLMFLPWPCAGAELDVRIEGIEGRLLENVRLLLSIARLDDEGREIVLSREEVDQQAELPAVTLAEVRRRHRAAPGQIREALMPFGYYLPEISAELVEAEDAYLARYEVDRGPPTRIRELNVQVLGEGRDARPVRDALRGIGLAEEQRLVHRRYQEAKSALFDAAFDHGFLAAAWKTSEIRVQEDRLHADIHLVLDTGPQFRFGEVTFEQDVLNPRFVQRFVEFEPGDRYDVQKLLTLQRQLSESEYFRRVQIQAPPEMADEDHHVPVTVLVEPAPSQRYTFGLGFGSDTGVRGNIGVLVRRLNERGHRLAGDLRLSEIERSIGLRYDIPIRNIAADRVSFSATARQEEVGDADIDQFAVGISHVVTWQGFRRHLYLQGQRELFEFGDEPQEGVNLLMPGVTLSRERANDLVYPTRGYRIWADFRAGLDALISDVSFTRLEISGSWVRGIGEDTRVLVRAEAGALWSDQFPLLPPSQRFFAGGDRSVRGYGFRDLGPRNVFGDVIGAERLLAGSVELERLFYGNFGAAVFVDAGDAFDSSPDLNVGAGVGLRWRSPIGVVRVDVAHPFDDPDNDFRLHITIGADI